MTQDMNVLGELSLSSATEMHTNASAQEKSNHWISNGNATFT